MAEHRECVGAGAGSADAVMATAAALTERTLAALASCAAYDELREACGLDVLVGPVDSTWADLLAALMEGLERDWVEEVLLSRESGELQCRWRATERGDRAIDAYVRRNGGGE